MLLSFLMNNKLETHFMPLNPRWFPSVVPVCVRKNLLFGTKNCEPFSIKQTIIWIAIQNNVFDCECVCVQVDKREKKLPLTFTLFYFIKLTLFTFRFCYAITFFSLSICCLIANYLLLSFFFVLYSWRYYPTIVLCTRRITAFLV